MHLLNKEILMISKIIAFSVRNKLVIGLFTFLLIGWGIYSVTQISINAVPDITNNQVQVITVSQNLAAQEVEQFITQPVELSLNNLPGVKEIRSISRFGLSVITVVFDENMGVYKPRQLVSEKIKEAQEEIGAGLGTPQMTPITTGLGEIYQYTVELKSGYEDQYSPTQLRTIQDWLIKRQLSGIEGVVEINSIGGYLKQYEIAIDPNQLNGYDLSIAEVYNALASNNENTGGSYIEKGPDLYYVRGRGLASSLEDLRKTVITIRNNIPVTIGDVGKVRIGHATRYGAATMNGKGETVVGVVMMLRGADSNKVIAEVKKRISEIQANLPEGVVIKPFLDRTRLIEKTTSTIEENLLLGGLIVIFALVFLLGTWRAGLIVASIIPLSLLFALSMMNAFGVSANLMSLGALDFGIIVDGAVIIVEFMAVRLANNNNKLREIRASERRKKLDNIAIVSSEKMMNAATFGQIIILIVFIPILTLQGVEGKMFIPMALAFGFAILGAMILCLTYVPMVSSLFLYGKNAGKRNVGDKFMDWLDKKAYQPLIKTALEFKAIVIVAALAFLGLAVFIFINMGGEFIPKLQEGDFALEVRMAPGTSLTAMKKNMGKVENILLNNFPEAEKVITKIGAAEVPTDPAPIEGADIMVALKPKSDWKVDQTYEELASKMNDALSVLPGVSVEFSQPIEMRFNELLTGVKSDLAVKIYGEDLQVLQRKGNAAASIIRGIKGAADVRPEQVSGLPQIVVDYDRDRMAQYGLQIKDINDLVSAALAGTTAGQFYEGEKRFDIVVRLQKEYRQDIESIKNLYVPLSSGEKIPLQEVADVHFEEGPNQISRDNTYRRIVVGVNVRNRDIQTLVKDIKQKLDQELHLPPGYYITYGGEFENLQRASKRLSIVVPLALAMIFIILFISLRSFKQTLLIYTAIPFAAVGGVFALWLRGMPFSISAGIGFIALFGVAVLNGLVLISYLNDLKEDGVTSIRERILQATRSRLRPIFLTAAVDILGFLPMAISTGAGAEVQRPLATVVIGGLFTATLLTLVLLPVFYSFSEKPFKMPKLFLIPLLFILGLGFPKPVVAQTLSQEEKTLSLEKVLQVALKNNPGLKASALNIEEKKRLEKTAYNLSKTNVYAGEEEVNPDNSEAVQSLGISQSFEFPTVYFDRKKVKEQETEISKLNYSLDEYQLKKELIKDYYDWGIAWKKWQFYTYLDSLYRRFHDAAVLRFRTGEASSLEELTAKGKQEQVQLQLEKAVSEFIIAQNNLERWMNEKIPDKTIPGRIKSELIVNNSSKVSPSLELQESKVTLAEKKIGLEKSQLLPNLNSEFAKQRVNGQKGFYAWQVGIDIPVFFGSQKSRIHSAKIEKNIQEKRLQDLKLMITAKKRNLSLQLQQLKKQLQYYQEEGLPLSKKIIENANLLFYTGEIGYIEYLQNIERAMDLRISWLNAVQEYNRIILDIIYIMENP